MSQQAIRVLLIYPPSRTQRHYSCPMGLLMLAAVLEQEGIEVSLLDANAAAKTRSTDEIIQHAAELRPDVIGITLVTPLVKEAYRLAAGLRPLGAKLLAGGPHATLLPEEPLEHGFDATVVGEGEPTVVEAIHGLLGRIPLDSVAGMVFRGPDGAIVRTGCRPPVADLDKLPLPARHMVDPADYESTLDGPVHANLFTSRGCPARCSYCAGALFGKSFRFRSADSVVEEMNLLYRRYGTRQFHFVDDAMTMDRARATRICQRLIEEKRGFSWSMMTRIDAVNEELLELASQAGCVRIDYGVESGNPQTLKRIHKPHTADMVRRVIPLTHRFGIESTVFFILGFPWEDLAMLDDTLRLMRDIAPYVDFHPALASILVPFPGTEIYEEFKDRFQFDRWWLSDDRTYDAPRAEIHPFYQTKMYRLGAVLDADFFRYSPTVKAKIHEVFRFMYSANLRNRSLLARTALLWAMDLSRMLHGVSPGLERLLFNGPKTLRRRLAHA